MYSTLLYRVQLIQSIILVQLITDANNVLLETQVFLPNIFKVYYNPKKPPKN